MPADLNKDGRDRHRDGDQVRHVHFLEQRAGANSLDDYAEIETALGARRRRGRSGWHI